MRSRPETVGELGERQRRRHRRAAHVHDGFVVRIVEFERLRERSVGERGRGDAHAIAESENAAGTGR